MVEQITNTLYEQLSLAICDYLSVRGHSTKFWRQPARYKNIMSNSTQEAQEEIDQDLEFCISAHQNQVQDG